MAPDLDHCASIAAVGSGALARALLGGAKAAGRPLAAIASRSTVPPLAHELGLPTTELHAIDADVVLLCVPDDAIATVAATIPIRAGQLVVHGSGASGLDVLHAAAERGAHIGSLHPVMVLTRHGPGHEVLRGATAAVDGDAVALPWLEAFAHDLGLTSVRIDPSQRDRYHLSAALTGGLLTGLLADAASLWDDLGHDGAAALGPMVAQAGRQLQDRGTTGVVMGPAARGDAGTIAAHVALLRDTSPQLLPLYTELVRSCLRRSALGPDQIAAVESALTR